MANVYAIQKGNWSDGSTWSSGSVPTADDDVWLNGHIVNVSVNTAVTIGSLSNCSDSEVGSMILYAKQENRQKRGGLHTRPQTCNS